MAISSKFIAILLILITLVSFPSKTRSESANNNNDTTNMKCSSNTGHGCRNKNEALKLKLIAIASILVTSMIGVCLPLFSRTIPALQPDTNLFVLVKAFASGVILDTGYMHVLPDSFDCLSYFKKNKLESGEGNGGRDYVHNNVKIESQKFDSSHFHGETKCDDKVLNRAIYM
ncbi:hypothetical protein RND71_002181 [Anisodus tanguticus]|uniref:Uncharacterized protein n=1 Tax=Anisodus tanguticus TaxID=243964 RepID=A0AAE1VYI2_9SOLA|nr:hypothetical protein RND71_002181 [Anisodus tanguticus]